MQKISNRSGASPPHHQKQPASATLFYPLQIDMKCPRNDKEQFRAWKLDILKLEKAHFLASPKVTLFLNPKTNFKTRFWQEQIGEMVIFDVPLTVGRAKGEGVASVVSTFSHK